MAERCTSRTISSVTGLWDCADAKMAVRATGRMARRIGFIVVRDGIYGVNDDSGDAGSCSYSAHVPELPSILVTGQSMAEVTSRAVEAVGI
jgi:hypothetical protein